MIVTRKKSQWLLLTLMLIPLCSNSHVHIRIYSRSANDEIFYQHAFHRKSMEMTKTLNYTTWNQYQLFTRILYCITYNRHNQNNTKPISVIYSYSVLNCPVNFLEIDITETLNCTTWSVTISLIYSHWIVNARTNLKLYFVIIISNHLVRRNIVHFLHS